MWALRLLSGEGEDSPFPMPASPRASLHSECSGSPDAWRLSAPSTGPPPLQGVGSGFLLLVLEASPSMTRAHSCRPASWGWPRKALTQPPQFTFRGSLWVSHVDGGLAGLPGPPRASVSVQELHWSCYWSCAGGGLCSVWALEVGAAGPRGLRTVSPQVWRCPHSVGVAWWGAVLCLPPDCRVHREREGPRRPARWPSEAWVAG